MRTTRHPHSFFIDEVGANVIAGQFQISPQRLHMWRKRGIPHSFRPAIAQLATLHGKQLPADFLAPPAQAQAA